MQVLIFMLHLKKPIDYRKSDKEIIEELKVDGVYRDLLELDKLKTGQGFKII